MSRGPRAALFVACAVVTAALALVPDPSGSPIGRVAGFDGDGPDPRYDAPLDAAAIRRAGKLVPDDATYAIIATDATPVLQGNLKAGTQLFFAPAIPLQDFRAAEWVLVYGNAPPGFVGGRRLGGNLTLFRSRT